MTSYSATATRDGKWWMIRVDGIDGLTQARHLAEAELMAREFVAVSTDGALEDVHVELRVLEANGVSDIADRVARIQDERKTAAWLESWALAEAAGLAAELVGAEVPMRDVGVVLGVSHQRVSQLVDSGYQARLSPVHAQALLLSSQATGDSDREVVSLIAQIAEMSERLRDALEQAVGSAEDGTSARQRT